eukprot:m.313377 g.313377  ORF g.313377 m.313377 type:complete len:830 (+) comp27481_c0_seq1:68-2557(+)
MSWSRDRAVAVVVAGLLLLCDPTAAHITDICVSVNPSQCDTATLWLMTYHHDIAGISTGQVAVSVGTTPHSSSPFAIPPMCDGMAFTRPESVPALEADMGARWREHCPAEAHGQLSSSLSLVCFASVDTVTRIVTPRTPTERTGCGGCCSSRDIDEAAFITIDNVTTQQDISVAVFGVDHAMQGSGFATHACNLPSTSSAYETDKGAFGTSPTMDNLRFTIPAGTITIPECGAPCPAYAPASELNVLSHSCASESVAPGTPCQVQCPAGFVAAGNPVGCVGGADGAPGSYDGEILCVGVATSNSTCANGACPDLTAVVGNTVTKVTGEACGEATPNATECGFSCDHTQNLFSVGNLEAVNGVWESSNGAVCLACCGSSCGVSPDTTVGTNVLLKEDAATDTTAICVTGCNFDPINDRVVLIDGIDADCGSPNATAVAGVYLDCNTAAATCGAPSETLLACGGFPTNDIPTEGTVCICDSDVQNSCTNTAWKYVATGPRFERPGVAQQGTAAPTGAPVAATPAPTRQPTMAPTPAPASICAHLSTTMVLDEVQTTCSDRSGSGDTGAIDCYAAGKGSAASTAVDTDEVTKILTSWWGQNSLFSATPLNDAVLLINTTGVWDGPNDQERQLTVNVEYRPGAPYSYADVNTALTAVTGSVVQFEYCGCESTVTMLGSSVMVLDPSTVDTGATTVEDCPGAYIAAQNRAGDDDDSENREGATSTPGKASSRTPSGKKGGSTSGKKGASTPGKKGKSKKGKSSKGKTNAVGSSLNSSSAGVTTSMVGLTIGAVGVVSIAVAAFARHKRLSGVPLDGLDGPVEADEYTALIPSYN